MGLKAYLYIAAALGLGALVAAVFYYRGQAIDADARAEIIKGQFEQVVATNQLQQQAIDSLVEMKNKVNEISANLSDQFETVNQTIITSGEELQKVKESNPDAKTFLDTPIPDSVKRLQSNP